MNRYDILLGKSPPIGRPVVTAAAPNLVVDSYGRLIASSKPEVGSIVYVNDQPIGVVYNADLNSNQIEISTNGYTTNMTAHFTNNIMLPYTLS